MTNEVSNERSFGRTMVGSGRHAGLLQYCQAPGPVLGPGQGLGPGPGQCPGQGP